MFDLNVQKYGEKTKRQNKFANNNNFIRLFGTRRPSEIRCFEGTWYEGARVREHSPQDLGKTSTNTHHPTPILTRRMRNLKNFRLKS